MNTHLSQHYKYLQQALELAEIRRGFCAPNPAVGAVVVKDNKILATGMHWACGHAHAEVDALNKIGEEARGATLYVTLEPCCHWGRTPPCSQLLIDRGIKTVFYGLQDPNPKVAGQSQQQLQAANIECIHLPTAAIDRFYQSYIYWTQTQRPWVTAKLAMSLDGKIADPNYQPIAITGPQLQTLTHQQRKRADAILTTAKTILHDDPQLNVRLTEAAGTNAISKAIYVLDSQLTTPLSARIFHTASKIVLFHSPDVSSAKIAEFSQQSQTTCVAITLEETKLNLLEVLAYIGKDGIHNLWLEAGGRCFQTFIENKLAHHALLYVASKCLGANAISAFDRAIDFSNYAKKISWKNYGNELVCEMEFVE